jgi:signal peptidase I
MHPPDGPDAAAVPAGCVDVSSDPLPPSAAHLLAFPEGAPSVRPPADTAVRPAVRTVEAPLERPSLRSLLDRRWLLSSVQVFGLALLGYLFLFNFSVVRGSSMAPRIHDGDRIVIDHFSYWMHKVERGDIVVLKYPLDPSIDYIKRVVGLPGDFVRIQDGRVWINGTELQEPYVEAPDPLTRLSTRVQPAHFFVLGDNRRRSSDSREFGQVPQDYVRGKVQFRIWPPERIGTIDS